MSTTTTADEIRAHTRAMWGGVAGGWEQHADYVETRGAHVTELMLARTAPRPGERVLELASGAGDLAIAAAPLVAPAARSSSRTWRPRWSTSPPAGRGRAAWPT